MTNADVTAVCLMTVGPGGSSPAWNTDSAERHRPQFAQDVREQNEIGAQEST